MKYFKDINNQVFAYESDGSQDSYISSDLIVISEDEAKELIKKIQDKIDQKIESTIPASLTKRQLMLQLNKLGLYQKVMDLINKPEYLDLKIEYDCSTEFARQHNLIVAIAKQFDLSSDDIDNLFIEAVKL
ncbi:hypothetical protein RHO12_10475 [Orbus sturtevantii]|uniref:hypothetical protein n=1 Tax=Orbus sturtevantii TaxID=3074109 RepID=UPI00370D462E